MQNGLEAQFQLIYDLRMDRRRFLETAVRLGGTSVVSSVLPLQAVAADEETRRLLWYSSHCVDCGEAFEVPETLLRTKQHGHFWCWFCAWHGRHQDCAMYRDNPPADWLPG